MKERTIVALVSIGVIGALVALGHNSAMISLLAIILGFYFGRDAQREEVE